MRKNPVLSKKGRGAIAVLVCLFLAGVLGINAWIAYSEKPQIKASLTSHVDQFSSEELAEYKAFGADCIMVLGAAVYSDGTPSPMLKDRLDTGIALYKGNAAPKLLLTGDNGQEEYNEVEVMLRYAIENGVPEEDVFLDHAGFSTYESVYRADDIFEVRKMIVVTQSYHLFRALYGCRAKGIEALGAGADQDRYVGRHMRELREVLARDKDWAKWIVKPEPTYLGDKIPISGDGTVTH